MEKITVTPWDQHFQDQIDKIDHLLAFSEMLKNDAIAKRLLDLKQGMYETLDRFHLEFKNLRENSKPPIIDDSHACIKDWNCHSNDFNMLKTEIFALIDGNKPQD